jgi:hypothetical protein
MRTAQFLCLGLAAASVGAATLPVTGDTYVSQTYQNQSFGNSTTLNIGGGNSALIAFDLSSLPAGLTKENIKSATVTVFLNRVATPGGVDISPLTSAWSEAGSIPVTYANRPAASAAILTNVPVAVSDTYVTFDLTALMQDWVTGASSNYGLEITPAALQPATVGIYAAHAL